MYYTWYLVVLAEATGIHSHICMYVCIPVMSVCLMHRLSTCLSFRISIRLSVCTGTVGRCVCMFLLVGKYRDQGTRYQVPRYCHTSIEKRFSPLSFHSAFPPSPTPTVVSACRHPTRRTSKRPLTSLYPAKLPLTIQIKSNFRESQSYAKVFPLWAVYAWAAIVILVKIPSYHHLCIKTLEFPWWFVATFKLASIVSLKLHRLARTFGLGMDARSASDVWLKTIAGWHRGRK